MGSLSIWHWMLFGAVALLAVRRQGQDFRHHGRRRQGHQIVQERHVRGRRRRRPPPPAPRTLESRARRARRRRRQAEGRLNARVRSRPSGARVISMFDFDAGKLIVFGIVALAVIPPKDLPRVLRTVGKYVGQMRRMAAEFQGQFMDGDQGGRARERQEGDRRDQRGRQGRHVVRSRQPDARQHRKGGRRTSPRRKSHDETVDRGRAGATRSGCPVEPPAPPPEPVAVEAARPAEKATSSAT